MVDVEKFISSLKCSWMKRVLFTDQAWLNIFKSNFGNDIVNNLYDFGDEYLTEIICNCKNKFWNDNLFFREKKKLFYFFFS